MRTSVRTLMLGLLPCFALGCPTNPELPPPSQPQGPVANRAEGEAPSVRSAADPEAGRPSDPLSPHDPGSVVQPSEEDPLTAPPITPGTIRMGRAVGGDDRVPDSERTDVFMTYDPIHVSIEATDMAAGDLAIYSEGGGSAVWTDREVVAPGATYLSFAIRPGGLPPGNYRAVVTTDSGHVDTHRFSVSDGGA